jgi:hypothetical protein
VDQYAGAALPQSEYVSVFRSPLHEGNAGATFADLRRAPLMGDFTAMTVIAHISTSGR